MKAAKILVVDDNEANRALALHTLEDEGYRVVLASGGVAGIAAYERERPDCLLLDVRMPDLDGFEVCQRIRGLPGGAELPVVFLTALRDVDTFDSALRAGGDDFLTKPVRPTELVIRIRAALRLRRMHVELREHYTLLKEQRDALMRLQLQKERLTAFVIHDLKNPVNVMDLHAQFLLRERDLSETAHSSAAQIRTEARHLSRMILNLLDVSKADEGRLVANRTKVDLRQLVSDLSIELEASARVRKVTVVVDLAVDTLNADAELLRRTLTNLAENAIRHAPAGSAVEVASRLVGDATEVSVRDAGSGIPPEMHAKIFDPFLQIEEGDRSLTLGGRGLGLTFCKLAVEAHGGVIAVEDGSPGAVFRVRIPDAQS